MPDKVTELEFFNLNYEFPCMYSGFVEVDAPTGSNLYYWLIKEKDNDNDAPLVLWINGGPGASGQIGNLLLNGPLKFAKTPTGGFEVHSVTDRAWTAVGNMLYLDQPIGSGYSYGDLVIESQKQARDHTLRFILGFYAKHPEMKGKDFFITGESYGGKFLPNIADAILEYNKLSNDDNKIPFKGMMVGNGFVDPIVSFIIHLSF
jgi:carboxypeptidase C (cathepsin A)